MACQDNTRVCESLIHSTTTDTVLRGMAMRLFLIILHLWLALLQVSATEAARITRHHYRPQDATETT